MKESMSSLKRPRVSGGDLPLRTARAESPHLSAQYLGRALLFALSPRRHFPFSTNRFPLFGEFANKSTAKTHLESHTKARSRVERASLALSPNECNSSRLPGLTPTSRLEST